MYTVVSSDQSLSLTSSSALLTIPQCSSHLFHWLFLHSVSGTTENIFHIQPHCPGTPAFILIIPTTAVAYHCSHKGILSHEMTKSLKWYYVTINYNGSYKSSLLLFSMMSWKWQWTLVLESLQPWFPSQRETQSADKHPQLRDAMGSSLQKMWLTVGCTSTVANGGRYVLCSKTLKLM